MFAIFEKEDKKNHINSKVSKTKKMINHWLEWLQCKSCSLVRSWKIYGMLLEKMLVELLVEGCSLKCEEIMAKLLERLRRVLKQYIEDLMKKNRSVSEMKLDVMKWRKLMVKIISKMKSRRNWLKKLKWRIDKVKKLKSKLKEIWRKTKNVKKRFTYNKLVKEDWRIGKVKEMKSKLMETQRNAKKNSRKWRKSLNMKRKDYLKLKKCQMMKSLY